jgi:hypothetical protein
MDKDLHVESLSSQSVRFLATRDFIYFQPKWQAMSALLTIITRCSGYICVHSLRMWAQKFNLAVPKHLLYPHHIRRSFMILQSFVKNEISIRKSATSPLHGH